ncbi:MAG: hypothetical protein FAF05_06910 [Epsilonproteobacteria bacterium]|nr:hypothetical protein [Campylobacterota bacterium]
MKKIAMSAVAIASMMSFSTTTVSAEDGINILDDIVVSGQIRPRYEYADVKDNGKKAANAYTARTKLNMSANLLGIEGLSTNIGIISVNNFGSNKYNSTDNGQTQYDIVKDPQKAMISNADINYQVGKTILHAGRSQVKLDNQRFIGTVGWRQFERSYDTVYVADNSVKGLNLLAAWVYGYQGVGAGNTVDTNSILLHASYDVMPELKVTMYDYMLASLHDTYGIALTGKIDAGAKLNYRAEYAVQKDGSMKIHGVKGKADASYYNLDLGANISGILAGVNYEVLSGDGDGTGSQTAFNPALGTNHKFNGWADVFYVASVPTGGLKDMNIRLGYKAKGFGKLLGVYHDFKADKDMGGTDDLGSEFDIVYVNAIPGVKNLSGLVKYAQYSKGKATGYTNDKTVAWLQLDYKFSTK